jgi:hypothetical protein
MVDGLPAVGSLIGLIEGWEINQSTSSTNLLPPLLYHKVRIPNLNRIAMF